MSEHKVEGCQGRWIDAGTLHDPLKQLCSACRASRQKPTDDGQVVEVLDAASHRRIDGLTRLKQDLESDALAEDSVRREFGLPPDFDFVEAELRTIAWLHEQRHKGRRVERLMFFALGLACGVMLGVLLMQVGAL